VLGVCDPVGGGVSELENVSDADFVTVGEKVCESVISSDSVGGSGIVMDVIVPEYEREIDADTVGCDVDADGERERLVVGKLLVIDSDGVVVGGCVIVADTVAFSDSVGMSPESDAETVRVGSETERLIVVELLALTRCTVPLGVQVGLTDKVRPEKVALVDVVPDRDSVDVSDREKVSDELNVCVRVGGIVSELVTLMVEEKDRESENVGLRLAVNVSECEKDGLGEALGDRDREQVSDRDALTLTEAETVSDAESDGDTDAVIVSDEDDDTDREKDSDLEPDAETDRVNVSDVEALIDGVKVVVLVNVADGVMGSDRVAVRETVGDGVRGCVKLSVADSDRVRDVVIGGVSVGGGDGVGPVRVPERPE
jgi:hypothetical protein